MTEKGKQQQTRRTREKQKMKKRKKEKERRWQELGQKSVQSGKQTTILRDYEAPERAREKAHCVPLIHAKVLRGVVCRYHCYRCFHCCHCPFLDRQTVRLSPFWLPWLVRAMELQLAMMAKVKLKMGMALWLMRAIRSWAVFARELMVGHCGESLVGGCEWILGWAVCGRLFFLGLCQMNRKKPNRHHGRAGHRFLW